MRFEKVSLKKLRREIFYEWAEEVGYDHSGKECFGTVRAYSQDGIIFSKRDSDFTHWNPDAHIIPCEPKEIQRKKAIWRRRVPTGIKCPKPEGDLIPCWPDEIEPKKVIWSVIWKRYVPFDINQLTDNSIKDI